MPGPTHEQGTSFAYSQPAVVRDLLARRGFHPACLEEMEEGDLAGRLWELLYALAGIQHFFCGSNHLSDRDFYRWLQGHWLAQPGEEREVPLVVKVADSAGVAEAWRGPGEPTSSGLVPAGERDRWLPRPTLPFDLDDDDWKGGRLGDGAAKDDLLAAGADGGQRRDTLGARGQERWERPLDALMRHGVSILPPDEIHDEAMPARMWALLHELACRGFYLLHTDHLGDRELYSQIWRVCLRDPALLPGRCEDSGWYHDFAEPGLARTPAEATWLRYYASEEERGSWALAKSGQTVLPARETPPCQRDWRLPKGPI